METRFHYFRSLILFFCFLAPSAQAQMPLTPSPAIQLFQIVGFDRWSEIFEDLTAAEKKFAVTHPWKAYLAYQDSKRARSEAEKRYGDTETDDISNAFKHCYWNALMAKSIGLKYAKIEADAHEDVPILDNRRHKAKEMDLYNNRYGRYLAFLHPHATRKELAEWVNQALLSGKLKILRGNLSDIHVVSSQDFSLPMLPPSNTTRDPR